MVVLAPVALRLPLAGTLALLGGLTAAAAVLAARAGRAGPVGAALAAALAGLTVGYALATETGTLVVLAALALVAAAVAGLAASRPVRTGAAAVAVLALAGEAAAVPLAAGSTVRPAGFLLLGVAAAAVATAAVLRRTAPAEALAVELAAAPVATAGVALAATRGWSASAAFGVLGLILAAAALRPDRRLLAYPAAASVQLAGWIALATAEVDVPEAYTVPLSLALLAVGLWRRRSGAPPRPAGQSTSRRGSTVSSWLAYGPALTVTAGPSLAAAMAGGTDLRPLLLGAAATATVLVGAAPASRRRSRWAPPSWACWLCTSSARRWSASPPTCRAGCRRRSAARCCSRWAARTSGGWPICAAPAAPSRLGGRLTGSGEERAAVDLVVRGLRQRADHQLVDVDVQRQPHGQRHALGDVVGGQRPVHVRVHGGRLVARRHRSGSARTRPSRTMPGAISTTRTGWPASSSRSVSVSACSACLEAL